MRKEKGFMMKNLLALMLMVIVIVGIVGCVPDVTPEVQKEIKVLPTTAESVASRRDSLESKFVRFTLTRQNITEDYLRTSRSIVEVNAQLLWAEHQKDTENIIKWKEMLNNLKMARASLMLKDQEVFFGTEHEVTEVGKWNKDHPGWWR